jgi:hypothetical protein
MAGRQPLRDAAARRDGGDRGFDVLNRLAALGIDRAAQIEREANTARDGIGRRARHVELAHSCHQVGLPARPLFDRQQHFGGSGQRIMPHRHRHGAGMAGDARDVDGRAGHAVDRGDDAERQTFLFQHRPLLDVHLDIAQGAVG